MSSNGLWNGNKSSQTGFLVRIIWIIVLINVIDDSLDVCQKFCEDILRVNIDVQLRQQKNDLL